MLIHLLRHGIAIDRADPDCPSEAERFLTDKGIRRTKAGCRGLGHMGIKADLILTSPFVRAHQTAEIARKSMRLKGVEIRETNALLWDADPGPLRAELASLTGVEAVLCAGHAPHLDLFISHMVGTPMPITELKKAGFATLHSDFSDPGDGTLLALYPPRALRELAEL